MKKISLYIFAAILVSAFAFQPALAQFPIKIPKLPKVPKTAPTPAPTGDDSTSPANENSPPPRQTTTTQSGGQVTVMQKPVATGNPMFLKDTFEIKVKTDNKYWKFPNQDYTSWLPQVSFFVFFNASSKLRYTADWTNPDGSPWFSESLEYREGTYESSTIVSPYSSELFETKATDATGTFGLKITNQKTGEVAFQGKFKVAKLPLFPGDAKLKNRMQFYADHDWSLPVGYVGFQANEFGSVEGMQPTVLMWFKGDLNSKDFEARLFYAGQQITSTDDGGSIGTGQKRGDENCFEFVATCKYSLWTFRWKNFRVLTHNYLRESYPNAVFTRDKPGEYTVKIFHRGTQVREAKFTVEANGGIAGNAFSGGVFLGLKIIPVKVLGTLDKWNAGAWKTDAFYGNPLSGFSVQ